jgi:vacuolar-type H+-ATPase subunit D/Vma8
MLYLSSYALNIGIDIDNAKLAMLLYVDDVVLLAENEKDLQKMLDVLNYIVLETTMYFAFYN